METLMDAEHSEEVSWSRISSSASLAFPKRCVEIITLADYRTFTCVKSVGDTIKMKETTSKLKVRICDGTIGVVARD